ncbi:6-bladed beta-propeller [Bacteroides nordii]|uniref:6-bladed beta-propeller n=1 Tax=Bacteroides nordii TaxID=291645 RepID=UPI00399B2730
MKHIFLFFVLFLMGCTESRNKYDENSLTAIKVDWDKVIDEFDYSSMVEDSVLMIPLETHANCLIGEVTKLIYQDSIIYIADNLSKSVFVFDITGKLATKINSPGNGPGEYVNITSFAVHDQDIVIFDHMMNRLFFYNATSGEFVRDKDISPIWGVDMFEMGNKLYLVNNDSSSESGYFHLFSIDLANSDEYDMYLPFEKVQDNQGWAVDAYYTQLEDEALIYYWPYNTLYTVKNEDAYPSYWIDFGKKNLPEGLIGRDGRKALQAAIRENYVTGIERVYQSKAYLFLLYADSENDYTTIYDKKLGNIRTAKKIVNKKMGNLLLQSSRNGYIIQDEKIIQCYSADYASYFKEEQFNDVSFYSEDLRQRFKNWCNWKTEEMNPIIFIQNLKQ